MLVFFFFLISGDAYKFTRDHATLKFHKPMLLPKVYLLYYMKYSSKIAENRACLQFIIELKGL